MAQISLGELKTLWNNVSDWVKGVDTVSAPSVKLTGRDVADTGSRKGFETNLFTRVGSIAANTPATLLLEVAQECYLETLEIAANSMSGNLIMDIFSRKNDGTYQKLEFISHDGAVKATAIWLPVIRDYKPSMFNLDINDTTNNRYKGSLNKRLHFANGLKIEFRNTDTVNAYNFGLSALVTKMAQ
jgi:hypothetical protein